MNINKRDISIIIPVYNEEKSILELYNEISASLNNNYIYELIFINDGSSDNSKKIILDLANKDKNIKLIDFFKNRGKAEALNAGFKYSNCKTIITMDADLQDDPHEISNLINKLDEGFDLVSGWKKNRKDPISKTLPSKFFNFIVGLFSGIKIHDFNCGLKAYNANAAKSIYLYGGLHRFIPVLIKENGFSVAEVIVNHRERKHGVTKYGSSRLLHGLYDFITILFLKKYFTKPLHFFGKYGIILSAVGMSINLFLAYKWIIYNYFYSPIQQLAYKFTINRPLLYLGILLLIVGVQFISLGLIGELIVRISRKNKSYSNSSHFYNFDK